MDTITVQLTRHKFGLLRNALSEEIRLVDSYINKSDNQRAHLAELRNLWFEVDEAIEKS